MSFEATIAASPRRLCDRAAASAGRNTRHGMACRTHADFAVYRNNVAVGLIGAIEARYPVVGELSGQTHSARWREPSSNA